MKPNIANHPDAPHHYQARRVTWRGKRYRGRWGWEYRWPMESPYGMLNTVMYDAQMPCRHCGGSEGLPVHLLAGVA